MSDTPSLPRPSALVPTQVSLEPGNYAWCSCGLTSTPPFCDGAHKGTSFRPKIIQIREQAETLWLCECKQTQNPPFCDGSHAACAPPAKA